MLEQFQSLIYINEVEKKKIEDECIDLLVRDCEKKYSREEILKAIFDETNELNEEFAWSYFFYLTIKEGHLLFNKVAEKFGNKLWQGKAWQNKTCQRKCPMGNVCKKSCVKIDDEIFCYGQLYLRKITIDKLCEMTEKHNISLLNSNGTVQVNLNNADDYERQNFTMPFNDIDWYIVEFGEYNGRKINGQKFIQQL